MSTAALGRYPSPLSLWTTLRLFRAVFATIVPMNEHTHSMERTWLTVDEAYGKCLEASLPRTKKTIRSWCRQGHVTGQKQTTQTGERWVVEASSLSVKIDAELELQSQFAPVQTSSHLSEPLPGNASQVEEPAPVQTGSDPFEPVRTSADPSEPVQTEALKDLQRELRSLEIDKAVRDRQIEFLEQQNAKGSEQLLSQSRYIGHLETKLVARGGTPDQSFLQAPVPKGNTPTDEPRIA